MELRIFCYSVFRDRAAAEAVETIFEKKAPGGEPNRGDSGVRTNEEPLDGGVAQPGEHLARVSGWHRVRFPKGENRGEGNLNGGVAQLGEHLPCKQGVMGSIPIISTRSNRGSQMRNGL